jgi:hypothetical protein
MLESVSEKLIVAFVITLISFLQLTVNFYVLGPALGGWTSLFAQKILGPMNILLISLYVNYYLACTTDPGTIPEGWVRSLLIVCLCVGQILSFLFVAHLGTTILHLESR